MDGLVICLPSHLSPCFSLKSRVLRNGEALCLRSGKLVGLQVLRKSWLLYGKNSLAIGSLHESAASFGEPRSEDDSEEPRIPENEVEVSVVSMCVLCRETVSSEHCGLRHLSSIFSFIKENWILGLKIRV